VPQGTVADLIERIDESNLWNELFSTAKKYSDQWMLDLSMFFPDEAKYTPVLARFLSMVKSEHGKICFAQNADEWSWSNENKKLIHEVIEEIREIIEGLSKDELRYSGETLESVIDALKEKYNK
jgi:hypothetical protein